MALGQTGGKDERVDNLREEDCEDALHQEEDVNEGEQRKICSRSYEVGVTCRGEE
jgi:hypothetical protein